MKIETHLEIDRPGGSIVEALSDTTGLSKASVKTAMTKGAVWLSRGSNTQRVRRAKKTIIAGDTLHLYFDEAILAQRPSDALLIADEGDYSIWHKPYGMLSQGSKWGDHCTIHRWVEGQLEPQRPAFITHRLDRAATGLMIIAHSKKTAAYFAEQFRRRAVEKRYRAVVLGCFPESRTFNDPIEGRPALTHATRLDYEQTGDLSLVDVEIATGRKHQIRRHLAGAGFPILGDRLYGNTMRMHEGDLSLAACHLRFVPAGDNASRSYTLPPELRPSFP